MWAPARGPGTKRFSNDVEQSWEQSAKDVAHTIERVARDIKPRRIIANGDASIAEGIVEVLADTVTGSLVEILVRATLATGSSIRVVGGGMEQSPSDGIGAILRFPADPATAS